MLKLDISKHALITSILLILALSISAPSLAFEITPFTGYRVGGEVEDDFTGFEMELDEDNSYGVSLNFDTGPGQQIELRYSHQETTVKSSPLFILQPEWNIDVDYLSIGGLLSFNNHSPFRPFVAGGVGAAIFDPEQFDSESRFNFNLGGGAKYYFNDRFGIRLEGRGYWTFFESNEVVFCSNGFCRVIIDGDVLGQFEASAGLIFKF